jgi:hypothetical protein
MKGLSAHQQAVLARLAAGETIYAWNGVSQTTAYALVRLGKAEWAVEPHVVRVHANARGSRTRHQLEWGLRAKGDDCG